MFSWVALFVCVFPVVIGTSTNSDFYGRCAGTAYANKRSVAVDSQGRIHVVWDGGSDILYSFSDDSGNIWSTPLNISNTPGEDENPSISISPGDTLNVVWSGDVGNGMDILMRRYYSQWLRIDTISSSSAEEEFVSQTIGKNGDINVVWTKYSGSQNSIVYSKREGGAWTSPFVVDEGQYANFPAISVDTLGNIYVFWSKYLVFSSDVFVRKYTASTHIWGNITNISRSNNAQCRCPSSIICSDNYPAVVYDSDEGSGDISYNIYLAKYNGSNWVKENVSEQANCKAIWGHIVKNMSGNLFVFWMSNLTGNYDVYLRKKSFAQWDSIINISNSPENSGYPNTQSLVNQQIPLIWTEGDSIPYDIMHDKLETGSGVKEGHSEGIIKVSPGILFSGTKLTINLSEGNQKVTIYDIEGRIVSVIKCEGKVERKSLKELFGKEKIRNGIFFLKNEKGFSDKIVAIE